MQFIINNATILGFSQEGTFFDGDFRFGNKRIINLECLSTDISNESDVSSHAVRDLIYLSKTDDYQRVHINGISFDTVKFTSFNVDGDEWVRGATCSISLEAYEEGTIDGFKYTLAPSESSTPGYSSYSHRHISRYPCGTSNYGMCRQKRSNSHTALFVARCGD